SGTGIDAVHVYAVPAGGNAIFLGAATYGTARPDVAALYGSRFLDSGFVLPVTGLPIGTYTIIAFAHSTVTGTFDGLTSVTVTVTAPSSNPVIAIDAPAASQLVTSAFEVAGWAADLGASAGTGVDAVQFYVFPNDGGGAPVFVGAASYGLPRPDVGALLGTQFTNCGYHFTITGLGPGAYLLAA